MTYGYMFMRDKRWQNIIAFRMMKTDYVQDLSCMVKA